MRRLLSTLLLTFALAPTTAAVAGSEVRLPDAASDRVLFAQIFDSRIKDGGELVGHRAFVWGAVSPSPAPSVYATYYYPSNRDLDRSHTVEWYRKNRPDWVAYACDRKTPAYDHTYAWGAYVPLDITRLDVRNYILTTFLIPAIEGGYSAIAFDNVSIQNGAHRCGVWRGSNWVQQFSGNSRDAAFAAAILDYINWVRREAHARGAALALNAKMDARQQDLTATLLAAGDIWLDEGGFSSDCRHLVVDDVWRAKFSLVSGQAAKGAYVSMNTLCGPFGQISASESSWILANFLLVRGARSYLAVVGPGEGGQLLDYGAAFDPPLGQPSEAARSTGAIYLRRYQRGLVVVNPSSHASASLILPAGRWFDVTGRAVPPTLDVEPRGGVVLLDRSKP